VALTQSDCPSCSTRYARAVRCRSDPFERGDGPPGVDRRQSDRRDRSGLHERTEIRTNQRDGTRSKLLTTKAGDVELAIPKLRHGSFFLSILERRRRIDRALFAVVMEAYVIVCAPARSTIWSTLSARRRGSPRAKSAASAANSTSPSRRSGTGHSITSSSRTCSWTPPTSKLESVGGSCPGQLTRPDAL
jgi:hypothetical protein